VVPDRAHGPGPVFVGGTGRSGTTIAGELIGHSATYELIPVEVRFHADLGGLPDLVMRRVTVEQFVESMKTRWYWREPSARGTPRGLHTFVEKDAFEDALARLQAGFPRDSRAAANRLIHDLLDPVAEGAGKPFWVEMTPPVLRVMPVLEKLLPDARFVHMIRDGRDVATSVVLRSWGPNDFASALDWWARTMIAIGRAEANTPSHRVLRLRLEAFVGPQREVAYQRLCNFLGVGDSGMRAFFDESVTRAGARIGRWRKNRDADEIAEVDKLYRATVARLEDAGVSMPVHDHVDTLPTTAAGRHDR
jgi:Sulfotransferase family